MSDLTLQRCWSRRLKVKSKKEHDLQRRESRKSGGGKSLHDVEGVQ